MCVFLAQEHPTCLAVVAMSTFSNTTEYFGTYCCAGCCMAVSRTSELNEYFVVIDPRFRQRIYPCTVVVDEYCCCRAMKLSGVDVYKYSTAALATHTAVYRRIV